MNIEYIDMMMYSQFSALTPVISAVTTMESHVKLFTA